MPTLFDSSTVHRQSGSRSGPATGSTRCDRTFKLEHPPTLALGLCGRGQLSGGLGAKLTVSRICRPVAQADGDAADRARVPPRRFAGHRRIWQNPRRRCRRHESNRANRARAASACDTLASRPQTMNTQPQAHRTTARHAGFERRHKLSMNTALVGIFKLVRHNQRQVENLSYRPYSANTASTA